MNKEQKLPTSHQTIFQEATTIQPIENLIFEIRGQQVMLDRDLAMLYGVETKRLNEQVRRNLERFPEDFMFQLNQYELANWKSQIATSNSVLMGLRKCPFAFTENGVAMLSGVLKSPTAVAVNIQIMRAFTTSITPKLALDLQRHNMQYAPVNILEMNKIHDRFLCIDDVVYHIGASLKDLGKKWFAFSKMQIPTELLVRNV